MKNKQKQLKIKVKKQVEALNTLKSNNQLTIEDVIPKNALNNDEAKKELDKIKEIEKNVDREKVIYKTSEYIYIYIRENLYIFLRIEKKFLTLLKAKYFSQNLRVQTF